jgi:hypothetical protein
MARQQPTPTPIRRPDPARFAAVTGAFLAAASGSAGQEQEPDGRSA